MSRSWTQQHRMPEPHDQDGFDEPEHYEPEGPPDEPSEPEDPPPGEDPPFEEDPGPDAFDPYGPDDDDADGRDHGYEPGEPDPDPDPDPDPESDPEPEPEFSADDESEPDPDPEPEPADDGEDVAEEFVGSEFQRRRDNPPQGRGVFVPRWVALLTPRGGNQRLVLAQVAYFLGETEEGKLRSFVERDGHHWVRITYRKLGDQLYLGKRQVRFAVDQLVEARILVRYDDAPQGHIKPPDRRSPCCLIFDWVAVRAFRSQHDPHGIESAPPDGESDEPGLYPDARSQ